jgi:hypothetical protein
MFFAMVYLPLELELGKHTDIENAVAHLHGMLDK